MMTRRVDQSAGSLSRVAGLWCMAAIVLGLACGGSSTAPLSGDGDAANSGGSAGATGADAGSGVIDSGGLPDSARDGVGASSCKDDTQCKPLGLVCDPLVRKCVECLFDASCGPNARGVDRRGRAAVACTNSLDCVNAPLS